MFTNAHVLLHMSFSEGLPTILPALVLDASKPPPAILQVMSSAVATSVQYRRMELVVQVNYKTLSSHVGRPSL